VSLQFISADRNTTHLPSTPVASTSPRPSPSSSWCSTARAARCAR
jgi:hypothetical protein